MRAQRNNATSRRHGCLQPGFRAGVFESRALIAGNIDNNAPGFIRECPRGKRVIRETVVIFSRGLSRPIGETESTCRRQDKWETREKNGRVGREGRKRRERMLPLGAMPRLLGDGAINAE